ncbi:hypothetical protein ABT297_29555 [Dactylosporangium sp. NPDC000555]|uniref:hypothetical protein n=1 Tax=Dactylosporangium sp. NPDC000555 TaxID=3154260 RepID=UPI00332BCCD1
MTPTVITPSIGRSSRRSVEDGARAKISISLTGEAAMAAEAIAREHSITEGEAVRRAIAVLKFMTEEMARGTVFRMQTPDGESERLKIVFT